MSKRKKNKQKRAHLARFASDRINTSQRPRFLILDGAGEWCRRCQAYKKDQVKQRKCIIEECIAEANGDNWFANQERVRTTEGPANGRLPTEDNTWVEQNFVEDKDYRGRVKLKNPSGPPDEQGIRHRSVGSLYEGSRWRTRAVLKSIPPTKGIGGPNADTGDIQHTKNTLPREATKIAIKKLPPSDKEKEKLASASKRAVDIFMELNSSAFKQWVETYHHIVLFRHGDWVIKRFFCGDKYRFVEERYGVAKVSVVYRGRDKAELAYETRITWSESFSLSN